MRIKIIYILLIFLLLCSCTQNNSTEIQKLMDSNTAYLSKIKTLESEINTLKDKNIQLDTENTTLKSDNYELQKKNSELEHSQQYLKNLNNDPIFSWIYNSDWDTIKIQYNSGKSEKEISSVKIAPYSLVVSIREDWQPEAMDKGVCIYEFVQGKKSYQLEIFKEHIFKYQDKFYYSESNLFDLYDSFIPVSYDWLKTDNAFNLIYNSKIVSWSNSCVATDRTKNVINYISSFFKAVPASKDKAGTLIDILKCYNHGEVVTIRIYDNYIRVQHNNTDIWYKSIAEYSQPSGIISIFTAG